MAECIPVSVVVPAYNAGAYIAQTLASVAAQTRAVDEIIVVDDGSRDDTVALARAAGARVLEQTNAGVSVARNRGIAAARNAWIALLDADDLWLPDKIARQWSSLQSVPEAAFAFCDFSQFAESHVWNASVLHEIHRQFADVKRTPLGDAAYACDALTLCRALLAQNIIQPSALVIRKDVALGLGGFDERLLACQDYDFVMRLTRDHVGTFIDRPLVRYRRHATATTSNIPKSREGLVHVALRALTRPWEYSPETVAYFRRALPDLFLKCGFAQFRYGNPSRAREWLGRSVRERFSLPAAVLYALTFALETGAGREVRDRLIGAAARLSN